MIGPASRFIRRSLLANELGRPAATDDDRLLAGDDRLPDAAAQMTHRVDIGAPPERIWPWLLQMGCRRAGFYSIDALDNGGVPSAREIHPELQDLAVGDVIRQLREGTAGSRSCTSTPSVRWCWVDCSTGPCHFARERRRAWWMRIAHPIMESAQLRHLAWRAEGQAR